MPKQDTSYITAENQQKASQQELGFGYEWKQGFFGSPPGIPRAEKEALGVLSQ